MVDSDKCPQCEQLSLTPWDGHLMTARRCTSCGYQEERPEPVITFGGNEKVGDPA